MNHQTQLLRKVAVVLERGVGNQHETTPPVEDMQRKIERFTHLKAPTFDYSSDPLDVDDWLKVIESKLELTECIGTECAAIAAHRMTGAARAWW